MFREKLSDSLESNDFSNVRLDDLPIAENHVVKAARRSPNELLEEALGSNIMSRKMDLMVGCGLDVSRLHPFHLAVSYLEGSKKFL